MARYRPNRLFPIILIVVISVIAIATLISITRVIFFSGGATTAPAVDVSRQALLSTDANRMVRLTVRGPIVADENFRSYQLSVTPNSRTLVTYKGYLDTPIDTVNLNNTIPAYEQFVFALDRANLTKGTQLSGDKNDIRGICATGEVYSFEILQGDQIVKELWTSTCSGSTGSLQANRSQLVGLFGAQIPNAQTLISKTNL